MSKDERDEVTKPWPMRVFFGHHCRRMRCSDSSSENNKKWEGTSRSILERIKLVHRCLLIVGLNKFVDTRCHRLGFAATITEQWCGAVELISARIVGGAVGHRGQDKSGI